MAEPSATSRFRWYFYTIAMIALATIATVLARSWLGPAIAVFFIPVVVTVAIYGGYGPRIFASVVSTVVCVFFVVPPQTTIDIGMTDAIRLVVLTGISLTVSALSGASRAAQEAER